MPEESRGFDAGDPALRHAASLAERAMSFEDSQPMERRLVIRLLKYWRDLGKDEAFPSRGDIDPDAISDIWPHCAVLEVAAKETDPEFVFVGSELAATAGTDLTGRRLSASPQNTLVTEGLSYFGQVLAKKAAITYGGEFTDSHGVTILYRSIILPLSRDGTDIHELLAAANCREVASS